MRQRGRFGATPEKNFGMDRSDERKLKAFGLDADPRLLENLKIHLKEMEKLASGIAKERQKRLKEGQEKGTIRGGAAMAMESSIKKYESIAKKIDAFMGARFSDAKTADSAVKELSRLIHIENMFQKAHNEELFKKVIEANYIDIKKIAKSSEHLTKLVAETVDKNVTKDAKPKKGSDRMSYSGASSADSAARGSAVKTIVAKHFSTPVAFLLDKMIDFEKRTDQVTGAFKNMKDFVGKSLYDMSGIEKGKKKVAQFVENYKTKRAETIDRRKAEKEEKKRAKKEAAAEKPGFFSDKLSKFTGGNLGASIYTSFMGSDFSDAVDYLKESVSGGITGLVEKLSPASVGAALQTTHSPTAIVEKLEEIKETLLDIERREGFAARVRERAQGMAARMSDFASTGMQKGIGLAKKGAGLAKRAAPGMGIIGGVALAGLAGFAVGRKIYEKFSLEIADAIDGTVSFFTETIPNKFTSFVDGIKNFGSKIKGFATSISDRFVGILDFIKKTPFAKFFNFDSPMVKAEASPEARATANQFAREIGLDKTFPQAFASSKNETVQSQSPIPLMLKQTSEKEARQDMQRNERPQMALKSNSSIDDIPMVVPDLGLAVVSMPTVFQN